MRTKTGSAASFDFSYECVSINSSFSLLCISVNDFKSASSIDLGVTNKLRWIGEFAEMESASCEDQL